MTSPKMTRSDAWESQFPFDRQKAIFETCRGLNYPTAVAVVKEKFETDLPDQATWYRFRNRFAQTLSGRRIQYAKDAAEAMRELAQACGLTDEERIRSYESQAAVAAFRDDADNAKTYQTLALDIRRAQNETARLRLKEEDLRLAMKRVEILEAKNAKAVEAVEDATITDEERVAKIKGIFGIK